MSKDEKGYPWKIRFMYFMCDYGFLNFFNSLVLILLVNNTFGRIMAIVSTVLNCLMCFYQSIRFKICAPEVGIAYEKSLI